jgi:hypothetical protein
MPLEKRDVEIPLGAGGVDTGRDEKIIDGPKFIQLENAEISEFGALRSRLGYDAHDMTTLASGDTLYGVASVAPIAIASRGDNKVCISQETSKQTNIVEFSSTEAAWVGEEEKPTFVAGESYSIRISSIYDLVPFDLAINNGFLFISYESDDGAGTVAHNVLVYDPVEDAILSDSANNATGLFLSAGIKLAALGDYVLAFYITSSDDLKVRRIDATNIGGEWGSATTINTDCDQSTYFDVHGDGTDAYVACQSVATPANARVFSVDEDLNTTWSVSWATGGAVANTAIAIHKHATAAYCVVAVTDSTGIFYNIVDATDGSQDATDSALGGPMRNCIAGTYDTDEFAVMTEENAATAEDNILSEGRMTIAGTWTQGPAGSLANYGLAHKYIGSLGNSTNGQLQFGAVRASTYEAQIHTLEYVSDTNVRALPIARYSRKLIAGETRQGFVPTVVTDASGVMWFPFAGVSDVENEDGTITTKKILMLGRYDENDNKRLNYTEAKNSTILSGGWPRVWDGKNIFSLGFNHAPSIPTATPSVGSGSLSPSGTYQYKAVYEYTDNFGQRYQSATSLPKSVTMGGSDNTVTLTVRGMPDYIASAYTNAAITVYRTALDGTVFYKIDNADQVTSHCGYNVTVQTIVDETADSSLTDNALLYTEGGVLDNEPVPPFEHSVVHKNRLFVVDVENGDLAYSKEFLRGDGIHFSDEFRIPTGSRINRPLGIESMDENLIVFWEDKIGVVYGDGPNDLGEGGTFTLPRIVAYTGVKPDERRSIIKTHQGIFYKSTDGIKLFDRSMQVQDVGRDVIDLHTISGTEYKIVGAEHNQKKHQVMFTQGSGAGQAFVLVYDYLLNYWTRYIVNIDGTSNAVGSDMWDGDHVIVADAGTNRIFQQLAGQYYDGAVSTADTIEVVARTNWIKLDGLQGFQRIWRGWVLGNYKAAHALTVGVDFDYVQDGDSGSPYNILNAISVTSDPAPYQYKFGIPQSQKCQAIQFYLKMAIIGSGEHTAGTQQAELTGIRLEYGIAPRGMRKKNTQQT